MAPASKGTLLNIHYYYSVHSMCNNYTEKANWMTFILASYEDGIRKTEKS